MSLGRFLFYLFFVPFVLAGCGHRNPTSITPVVEHSSIKTNLPDTVRSMVYFEGGKIRLGSQRMPNELPEFDTFLKPFYLDKFLVTVKQFQDFVSATNFVTDAEKFGDAGVYDIASGTWSLIKGASWQWSSDSYRLYKGNKQPFSYDKDNKVIRGGSFLFDPAEELSYTISFRGFNTSETSLFNLGFRCAKDAK